MNLLKKILLEYALLLEQEPKPASIKADDGTPLWSKGFGNYSSQGPDGEIDYTLKGDGSITPKGQEGGPEIDDQPIGGNGSTDQPTPTPEPEPEPEEPSDSLDNLEGQAKLLAIDARQVNDTFRSTTESLKKKEKERQKYVQNGIGEMRNRYGGNWVTRARASGDQLEMVGPNGTVEKKSAGEWAEMFIEMRTNKNVGLGSDESRAGEAAIVHGVNELLNEYKKDPENFKMSRVMGALRKEFGSVVKQKGSKLTKSWASTALNTIESMIEDYGPDNIEFASWDTQEGNAAAGSWGHGTSADMFLKLKDGQTVGVSLKKDYKVFFMNGGFNTVLDELLDDIGADNAAEIADRVNMDAYFKRRTDRFMALANVKGFKSEAERMAQNCLNGEECPLGNSDIKRIKAGYLDSAFDKIASGEADNLTVHEMKILARIGAASNNKEANAQIDAIRNIADETLEEVFNVAIENEAFGDNLKQKVVQGLHLTDTLGVALTNLDQFVTYFGNEKFDNEDLLKYFLADDSDIKALQRAVGSDNKEEIDKFFRNRITLTYDKESGKAKINFRRSDNVIGGQPQYMALAFCNIRERGIGTSPTFELGVSTELEYVLKYGPKFDEWPKRAQTQWIKRRGSLEDDVDPTLQDQNWNDPLVNQAKELVRSLAMRELERVNGR